MALFAALCGLAASPALAEKATPATTMTSCEMTFSIKGWSAFYKTAKGEGQITCDNGQSASVKISTKGGGLTFGKSEVLDGEGTFSPVESIEKVFGSYATAEAHAGAVKSSSVQAMTKGEVSLALAGTGQGFDLGVSFGRFKITRK
jgi:hypothetical protein